MLVRVPRSIRLWLAILASLILGVGLAMASTGQAASDHGDCKNDNSGNHNGYVCDGGGTTATDPPGAGKTVDADHGDCKNDNNGNHYGYVCGGAGGGGCTSNCGPCTSNCGPCTSNCPGGGGGGGGGAA